MDSQKEREAFENKFPVPAHWIDFDGLTCKYICKYNAIDDQALKYQARWESWLVAKAQAVPEGFVLVKKRNLIGNPNVDFLQAPRWAKYWLMDGHSKKYWWSSVRPKKDMDLLCYVWGGQHFVGEAPSFGFAGPWNESLTSKKAMLEAQEQSHE